MQRAILGLTALILTVAANAAPVPTTVEGTLYYGVSAIGGETTGVVIETDAGKVYELEIKDPATLQFAETLDGKRAIATGLLKSVAGVEIPERTVVEVTSLAASGSGTVCRSKTSDYRLHFKPDMRSTEVFKGHKRLTTLSCVVVTTFPGQYGCYEPLIADAGYSVVMHETSGVPPKAELYEVFIWGRKLLDTLVCR